MKRYLLLIGLLAISLAGSLPTLAQDETPPTCKATDHGVTFTPDPCTWSDATAYTGWVSACHGAGMDPDAVYPCGTECYSPLDNCRIRLTCPATTPPPTGSPHLPQLDPITKDNARDVMQLGSFTTDRKIIHFDFAGDKMLFTYGDNVYIFPAQILALPEIEPLLGNGGHDAVLHVTTLLDRLLQIDPDPIVLHQEGLSGALFGPTGALVATSSMDGSVLIWDANIGEVLVEFQAHVNNVWEMAFSPDGTLLATAGNSTLGLSAEYSPPNQVAIWDVSSGALLTVIDIASEVHSLAFSPDGSILATGGGLSNVDLWDVGTGAAIATIDHAPTVTNDWVTDVGFSPDASQLVAISYSFARVYAVARWQEQFTIPDSDGGQYAAFGIDGSVVFSGGHQNVRISDAATGAELNTLLELREQQILLNMNLNQAGTLLITVVGNLNPDTNTIDTVEVAYWGAATGLGLSAEPEQPAATDTAAGGDCTVSATANVNLRTGPGTTYAIAGTLSAGSVESVDGQATGAAGFVWWHLERDAWVRDDVIDAAESCATVPERSP